MEVENKELTKDLAELAHHYMRHKIGHIGPSTGKPLPKWEECSESARDLWIRGAKTAQKHEYFEKIVDRMVHATSLPKRQKDEGTRKQRPDYVSRSRILAKHLYEMYRKTEHGVCILSGEIAPSWDHLPDHVRETWEYQTIDFFAEEVRAETMKGTRTPEGFMYCHDMYIGMLQLIASAVRAEWRKNSTTTECANEN